MNENDRKGPASEGEGGQAAHGERSEVSWEGGKRRQPYTNQGAEEQGPAAAGEFEAGDAKEVARRNLEQMEDVKRMGERTGREAPGEPY